MCLTSFARQNNVSSSMAIAPEGRAMRRAELSDPDNLGLSARQYKIVQVIEDSVRCNGYVPSLREIAKAVGLASTSSVSYQLSVLAEKGYLTREARRPRTAVLRSPAQHQGDSRRTDLAGQGMAPVPL